MKQLVKKILATMFVVSFMMSSFTAYASTKEVPAPRWSYLTMITAGMDVNNSNMATISVTCDSDIFDTNKITAKCELQQLNGSWQTIKTWTETNNDSAIMYTKSYAIPKNYSYRLKVTATVYKDAKLLETATEYFDYGYYQ